MKRIIWVGIGCFVLMLLAWGATQVGSVGIRRVKPIDEETTLIVSLPAVAGIETVVHWNVPVGRSDMTVNFQVRGLEETELVGQAQLIDETAQVVFPCIAGGSTVTLLMTDAGSDQVLAHAPIDVLPAGPDCIQ